MGFEVVVADINAAANKLTEAANGVKDADPSGDVVDIATALPGARQQERTQGHLTGHRLGDAVQELARRRDGRGQ